MRKHASLGSIAALLVLSITACGGGASAGGKEEGADGLVKVRLAALSIAQIAPMVLGKQQGIFAKHGIDLEIAFVEPPALVPAMMSGNADFIWNNPPAVLAARGNKVPIRSVTTVSVAGDDPSRFPIQVMVPKGSAIKTTRDLAGKTVATASLFQLNDLALMESLAKAGVEAESVKFIEIPFPNMADALAAGRADAVISTEPFVTMTRASGKAIALVSVSEGLSPTSPISVVAASEKFIAGNRDVVDDFRAAVEEVSAYGRDHDAEVRAVIPTITKLTPELAKAITLAPISTVDDLAGWQAWADLLVKVGVLDQKPEPADAFLAD